MIKTDTSFARYSRTFCWIVAAIWLLLAVVSFTGDSESSVINGVLWLLGAGAFAISAIFMGGRSAVDSTGESE